MYKKYGKRLLDIILSFIGIIMVVPLMAVLAILVRCKLGVPIIFKQERIGKHQKVFLMYKFRTMTDAQDDDGNLLPDQFRLTKFGRFLRSSSLDELPEFLNILLGDLSIIGPRPLLPLYLQYYTEYEKQRHSVRGGLIPPEVLFNNIQPTWEEQFKYEVEYAKNLTFLLDIKILFATMKGIFKRKSVDYGSYVRKGLNEERQEKTTNGRVL